MRFRATLLTLAALAALFCASLKNHEVLIMNVSAAPAATPKPASQPKPAATSKPAPTPAKPAATPKPAPTVKPTSAPTPRPTATVAPKATPTPQKLLGPAPTPSVKPTPAPSPNVTAKGTPTPSPTLGKAGATPLPSLQPKIGKTGAAVPADTFKVGGIPFRAKQAKPASAIYNSLPAATKATDQQKEASARAIQAGLSAGVFVKSPDKAPPNTKVYSSVAEATQKLSGQLKAPAKIKSAADFPFAKAAPGKRSFTSWNGSPVRYGQNGMQVVFREGDDGRRTGYRDATLLDMVMMRAYYDNARILAYQQSAGAVPDQTFASTSDDGDWSDSSSPSPLLADANGNPPPSGNPNGGGLLNNANPTPPEPPMRPIVIVAIVLVIFAVLITIVVIAAMALKRRRQ